MANLLYLTAGHGGDYKVLKCSDVKLDAITTDDAGKSYFFAGKVKKKEIVFNILGNTVCLITER